MLDFKIELKRIYLSRRTGESLIVPRLSSQNPTAKYINTIQNISNKILFRKTHADTAECRVPIIGGGTGTYILCIYTV